MAAGWTSKLIVPEKTQRPLRLARVTDSHWVRGMFFDSTIEIVRRTVGESAATAIKTAGVDKYVALRKYPMRDFIQLQENAANVLPMATFEEGVARTAEAAVEFFFDSIAGKTMRLLAGSDPHRLLSAAPNAYPLTIYDNAERTYERKSDRSAQFVFRNDLLGPCHQVGVFDSAVSSACGIKVTIDITQKSPLDFEFLVSW